ncbi:hypothetical protein D3C86_1252430 [compost metagenome]
MFSNRLTSGRACRNEDAWLACEVGLTNTEAFKSVVLIAIKCCWPALGKGCQSFAKVSTFAGLSAQFGNLLHRLHRNRLQVFEDTQLFLDRRNG